jgi:hypothetical protein
LVATKIAPNWASKRRGHDGENAKTLPHQAFHLKQAEDAEVSLQIYGGFLILFVPQNNFTLTCVINFFSKWRRRLTEGDDDGIVLTFVLINNYYF